MATNSSAPGAGPERYYIVIPGLQALTPEQRAEVERGGSYPILKRTHLPEHETFVDFLIERSLSAWTRSRG